MQPTTHSQRREPRGRVAALQQRRLVAVLAMGLSLIAGLLITPQVAHAAWTDTAYTYDGSAGSTLSDRWRAFAPSYVIYADARSTVEAAQVIDDLAIAGHIDEYKTEAVVMTPSNGTSWDATADLANFEAFERSLASRYALNNLKVIGIGSGATFVNNVLSQHAFTVAGILTYGGTIDPTLTSTIPVPTYVHAERAVADYYIDANDAVRTEQAGQTGYYRNPDKNLSLQQVVFSKQSDKKESVAAAFQNAWKTVFSKNYRFSMNEIEFYAAGFDPLANPNTWRLDTYPMYDELGITVNTMLQDVTGAGVSLWHEYLPKSTTRAKAHTVPLVVMLHGNGNDNRTQAETSGWPEFAAKNNIMLVAPEWQGSSGYTALGDAGTMALLDLLFAKYPQIDPSRVYLTGLSAGAMSSYGFGANNVQKIAAVAGSSAPFAPASLLTTVENEKVPGNYLPMYTIAGTADMYHPLPVKTTGLYTAIRAYALLNDITVQPVADLTLNPLFGTTLDGPGWTQLAGTPAMIGTFSNDQGVMIKLVGLDPYAHWNYKPAISDIWAFLSQYSRNMTTGELIITPGHGPK